MSHQSSPGVSRRAAGRTAPAITTLFLGALLLLSTAVAGGAAAPPAGRAVPPGQATPSAPTDAVTALQPEDQSGLFLNKFDCLAGTARDLDLDQLLQTCTVTANVTFDIFGPNLQQTSQGGFSLERLPAGQYTIRETVPAGYGEPIAYCGFGPTYDQLPAFSPVVVYDGYYEFALDPGEAIFCDWFNVPLPSPDDAATILINKHFCPPVSSFDAYAATIYDLAANCQEPASPVPFAVERGGARIASGTANGAPDLLSFAGLAPGTVSVIEEVPDGFDQPLAFCSVGDELGNDRAPLSQAAVDNDRIAWPLNAGDVVFCDWFNVPAPRGVVISVLKTECPEAGPGGQGSYDDYAAACRTPLAGVSFKLDGASTGNPGEQPTDANGQITWAELEADRYFLTEEVPAGYGPPVVFCSFYDPAALQQRSYDGYIVGDDNRIVIDIADGQSITCSWFNLSTATASPPVTASPGAATPTPRPTAPAATSAASRSTISVISPPSRRSARTTATPPSTSGGAPTAPASLTIRFARCETFYDVLAADADPVADCTIQPPDVGFTLAALPGSDPPAAPMTAAVDPESGEATFSSVAPGDYRLAEGGFIIGDAAFVTTCASDRRDFADYPFAPFALAAADGSVRLSLVAGETLVCDWYDILAEGTTPAAGLTLQVYDCEGDELSVAACDPAPETVRFVLVPTTGEDQPVVFETDETGTASLSDLAGRFTLSQVGRQPCGIEATEVDADGNLVLGSDRATSVNVFQCQ